MRLRSLLLTAPLLLAACSTQGPQPPAPAVTLMHPPAPTPTATQAPVYSPAKLAAPSGKYLGVALPGVPGQLGPLAAFKSATGAPVDMVEEYSSFGGGFDAAGVRKAWEANAVTLISWQSYGTPLAGVAAGADDAYILGYAQAVRALNLPVVVSFDHEFNGNWYPWGDQAASPAQFVSAWRHIHDLFAEAGATNVIWVWAPNVVNPVPDVALSAYWPGAQYVTWVGIIGYWTGQLGEDSWSGLFGPTEKQVEALTSDPILITETGVDDGPHKASRVAAMMAGLRDDPRVIGLVYFDYGTAQGKRGNWTLTSDSQAVAAYRAGAAKIGTVTLKGDS